MRYHHLVSVVAAVTLSGCVASSGPTPLERRAMIRAAAAKTYRSSEGFQNSRWGMTPADLLDAAPSTVSDERGGFLLTSTIDGEPATVRFRFVDDRLAGVDVLLTPARDGRPRHTKIRDALTVKYGAPEESTDTAAAAAERVGSYRRAARISRAGEMAGAAMSGVAPDPYITAQRDADAERMEAQALADAVASEHAFVLTDSFKTRESHVLLRTNQVPDGATTTITYRSVVYADRLEADESREKVDAAKRTASDL